jgi:ketosteroid isomerase-like protein
VVSENADIVRRSTDAYNRRDLEGIVSHWAPDAVLDWSRSRGPDAGVYRGREEILGFIERFLDAFEDARIDLGDVREVDEGVLVAENVTYFRGRDGIEVQARSAWVVTVRDGQQTSLTLFQSKREALEAQRRSSMT